MKVVFASTPCQAEEIKELINQLYSNVFPMYFTDDEIHECEKQKVLFLSASHFEQLGTLKEAYKVIASLQTIISILESENLEDQYMETFYKNSSILNDYGLNFPFEYHHFSESKETKSSGLSIYTKAANELLI
ncbi:YhcU family protein [Bacillus sp. V3B]|uniref:DUF5365 family protein n=1 Tax=Bacillus sp. V3B TaxID=2804915 RepID=UPI002109DAF5|nr:DUF5365 family protein [Bacillus sp. V3B]MCQ6273367.1 YhcU family protein [Bacillus sp. V3B]